MTISRMATSLDHAMVLTHGATAADRGIRNLAYLPGALPLVAGFNLDPATIVLYRESGRKVEQHDVSDGGTRQLRAGTFIDEGGGQFAVYFREDPPAPQLELTIIDRSTWDEDIIVLDSVVGCVRSLAYFDDGGVGKLLVACDPADVVAIELDGSNPVAYDLGATLGVLDVGALSAITTDPHPGAFALIDQSEMVVFTLD